MQSLCTIDTRALNLTNYSVRKESAVDNKEDLRKQERLYKDHIGMCSYRIFFYFFDIFSGMNFLKVCIDRITESFQRPFGGPDKQMNASAPRNLGR